MKTLLCLSFASTLSGPKPLPKHLDELIKGRVRAQYQVTSLDFDNSKCAFQGEYSYSGSQLVLSADNEYWSGVKELEIDDVLEGRAIDFSSVSTSDQQNLAAGPLVDKNSGGLKISKKWLWIGAGIVAGGTALYLGHKYLSKDSGKKDPGGRNFGILSMNF